MRPVELIIHAVQNDFIAGCIRHRMNCCVFIILNRDSCCRRRNRCSLHDNRMDGEGSAGNYSSSALTLRQNSFRLGCAVRAVQMICTHGVCIAHFGDLYRYSDICLRLDIMNFAAGICAFDSVRNSRAVPGCC